MKTRHLLYIILVVVSWGVEYLWIRFDLSLDLRVCGIHFVTLFLLPIVVLWPLISERVNLIEIIGRPGKFRWWILAFFIPLTIAGVSATLLSIFKVFSCPEDANIATRVLALIVDLPLLYVLWFPLIISTEICWRGSFFLRSGERLGTIGRSLIASSLWALSLAGFIWLGYSTNDYSPLTGGLSIVSLIVIGLYQSMIYRRSESILVSAFSLLCVLLINASVFEIPVTGIRPFIEPLHPGTTPTVGGFFASSCLLGLTGIALWGSGKKRLPPD